MPFVSYSLIPFVIPLLVGAAAALLIGGFRRPWPLHAGACLIAWLVSLVLQYCSYLVLGGILTGDWPQESEMGGVLLYFLWFAMIASFTAIPLVMGGYFGALAILNQRPQPARTK